MEVHIVPTIFDIKYFTCSRRCLSLTLCRCLNVLQQRSCALDRLAGCKLTEKCCEVVASALESAHSQLKVLDLSNNNLQKSEERLFRALQSQHCKLESLRFVFLYGYKVTEVKTKIKICSQQLLCKITTVHLIKFDNIFCRLVHCKLLGKSCKLLATGLQSPTTALIELDLSDNNLQDSVTPIFSAIPNCKLEKIRFCVLTYIIGLCIM